jgi:hypothetical protein
MSNLTPKLIPLGDLHFDLKNPRYGRRSSEVTGENEALELIVSDFLVDDLLSSISTNGFFQGEPLIATTRPQGGFQVIEGNRRLASLLILAGEPRASGQKKRTAIYAEKLRVNEQTAPREVPVIIVSEKDQKSTVLAYLGTKHIVGASPWDSYAKAKWMAQMKSETSLELHQIRDMIGDVGGLVERMLEGYYVIEQTRDSGLFQAEQSYIKGRGSNPHFPFSWVYSALGYSGVRKFLGIPERSNIVPSPIDSDHLQNSGDLFQMMFGDRGAEQPPVISESRDLSGLAKALADPLKAARLRSGTPLEIVEEEAKPISERLSTLIFEAKDRLLSANGLLALKNLSIDQVGELVEPAQQTFSAAKSFRDNIGRTNTRIRQRHTKRIKLNGQQFDMDNSLLMAVKLMMP